MGTLLPWLAAACPILLLIPGLVPDARADRAPRGMRRLVAAAAAGAAAIAALTGLLLLVGGRALPGPVVHLDSVSAVMLVLVATLGAVVADFSRHYLDGDPGQGRFMRWLALTLAAVQVLVLAGNLALLAAAWACTGLALGRLLLFYGDRPAARRAARKRAILARAAEACLLLALALVWHLFGTLDIASIQAAARGMAEPGAAVHALALLLALAAVLTSAQVPAHGWLTEVMETPTPVSALLHAGVINAGGYLLVRMADVVALSSGTLDLLLIIGAATAVFGAAAMLVQTSVKVGLAWSTVAQMGFMIMQVGLGAFAAAMLHIAAHATYKAHAFLSAGGVAAARRPDRLPPLPMRVLLPSLATAVLLVLLAGAALGMPATQAPGPAVLGCILAMGLVPTLATGAAIRGGALALRTMAIMAAVALVWFALQSGALALLGGALPEATAPRSALLPVLCILAVLAFATLLVLNVARRALVPPAWLGALHVHLLNGFYLNLVADRLLGRMRKETADA